MKTQAEIAADAAAKYIRAGGSLEGALVAGHAAAGRTETPKQIVEAALHRMELATGAPDPLRLRDRWPTIADANRAMSEAIDRMTPSERAMDEADANAQLDWTAKFAE